MAKKPQVETVNYRTLHERLEAAYHAASDKPEVQSMIEAVDYGLEVMAQENASLKKAVSEKEVMLTAVHAALSKAVEQRNAAVLETKRLQVESEYDAAEISKLKRAGEAVALQRLATELSISSQLRDDSLSVPDALAALTALLDGGNLDGDVAIGNSALSEVFTALKNIAVELTYQQAAQDES